MAVFAAYPMAASAAVSVLRPPREARPDEPLEMTIVCSGDAPPGSSIDVPRTVTITLTNSEALQRAVVLTRETGAHGHGEDILDYNRHRWIACIGFAVSRREAVS